MLEELYVQKNKYFDKHPRIYEMLKSCLGESILLMRSNELWSAKRKSLSAAFYKEKLGKMMNIIRKVVTSYVKLIEKDYIKTGTAFNLAQKINDLQVKIILNCAFGIDLGEIEMPYMIDGVKHMKKYSFIIKDLLNGVPMRTLSLRFFLYPQLTNHYIFPKEREILHNVKNLRQNIKDLITSKQKAAIENPSELDNGDLMTILISDPLFKDNIEMIIDECLTFFMAGTATTSSAVGTTIA